MWKRVGSLGPPVCLFEVWQVGEKDCSLSRESKESECYSLYPMVVYF